MPEPAPGSSPPTLNDRSEPAKDGASSNSLQDLLAQADKMDRCALLAMLRVDQRKRWQRGERILAEAYFTRLPHLAADEEAVLDMIYSEVVLRDELGDAPGVDEFVGRFPQYASALRRQFALNEALGSGSLFDIDSQATEPSPSGQSAAGATSLLPGSRTAAEDSSQGTTSIRPMNKTLPDLPDPVKESRPAGPPSVPGYEVLGELGRGGMGVVYKARKLDLKRTVALKMILSGSHASAQDLARLRIEADAVALLQHPNIVQIYDVGQHDGLPFLALEYVDGGSLLQKVAGTPLPIEQAAPLVECIAQAMQYAHEKGIVHRDLKPANILLSGDRNQEAGVRKQGSNASGLTPGSWLLTPDACKITDFGLAKQIEQESGQTRSGAILGTPSYMAPEQAGGRIHEVGPLTDVYSLGAILYELLTGRPPFRAATAVDTVLQVLGQEPVAPTRLNPKVPRDLETICLKCLQKEAHKRYGSAQALADDLRRFINNEPIAARPTSVTERGVKWVRRRPAIAGLLATIAAVSLVGVALVLWQWQDAVAERDAKGKALVKVEEEEKLKGKALRESETNLYYNRIALADREWTANNVAGVEELLNHYPGERSGWEWHYLKRLCHAELQTFPGETCAAFSPDGRSIASSTGLGGDTVQMWRLATGEKGREFKGHRNRIRHVAFSHDGKRLASASDDKTVRIWDTATGSTLHTLEAAEEPFVHVAFSHDDKQLAAASNIDTVRVWEVASGKPLHAFNGHSAVAFSPDDRLLATPAEGNDPLAEAGKGRSVKLWDLTNGQEVRALQGPHGHAQKVTTVAFRPDGALLATGSDDQTIKLWDSATGQELRTLHGGVGKVARVAFSPDGMQLAAVGGDLVIPGAVKVWDPSNGKELRTYRWDMRAGTDVAFHPDGKRLASADERVVKVWDTTEDPEARTCRGHTNEVNSVAFSPRGDWIAAGDSDGTVRLWDPVTAKQHIACYGHFKAVNSVAISPDGKTLASGSDDQTVLLWDPRTGDERRTLQHGSPVMSVVFSPAGDVLASAGWGSDERGAIKFWDAASGKLRNTIQAERVTSLAFSPDGKRLAGVNRERNTVHVWDAASSDEVLILPGGSMPYASVAFSPDGTRLATAGGQAAAGRVTIWDAHSGKELVKVGGRLGRVLSMAFSPDGQRLALGGYEHTIRLYDAGTGRDILTLRGHNDLVTSVAFSRDGQRIASGSVDRTIKIWDATPLPPSR
ncbi:MAG: protein kinase [Gemmataceae bacterium]|nr:protein kinase [Gemmataceae bacterium]